MPSFEITHGDGAGRLGKFRTEHGTVQTPTLLPVINPNIDLISAREMREKFGVQMVITNSYIIRRSAELREKALAEGVHKVLDWDGPVMTDSGTFQMYVYGKVEVQPEEIVGFQRDIGVDVGTILDIFSTPDRTRAEAASDVEETLARALQAADIKGERMALAATVQGSVYPDLRTRCATAYRDMAVDFHPVGGVVPLMEGQRYRDLVDVIVASKQGLDPSRPVHLFGAGHPLVFPMAVLLGCDFFDSSAYAKYAKDGRMILSDGTVHLQDLTELPCDCPVCSRHTAEELRKSPDRVRLLAEHNLHVTFREMRRVREALRRGTLWELVEMRARAHPSLLDALKRIVQHGAWVETQQPLSKPSAFFYCGPESAGRPEVLRSRSRLLGRFDPRGRDDLVLLPPARRPYSATYRDVVDRVAGKPVVLAARSVFGPVPLSLDETYPLAQSVEPTEVDPVVLEGVDAFVQTFADAHGMTVHEWEDVKDRVDELWPGAARETDEDVERVRALCDWQFGPGAADAILQGELEIHKSRKTRKIRTVHAGGEHVLSLRAEDGLWTLKEEGARRLHAAFEFPRMRVVVGADSAAFNRQGKSVFAKFVERADPELRPREECLVVDWSDRLVAVGVCLLAGSEMTSFKQGVAVDVREGVPEPVREE